MTAINIQWLKQNFVEPICIFDIGCADIGSDTMMFSDMFPNSIIYAFECANCWKENNIRLAALRNNINYYHVAMAGHSDGVSFYPSMSNHDKEWLWSGSIYKPGQYLNKIGLEFGEPYIVPSVTLDEFCNEQNVIPNFIHIDAQGAEYSIFKNMKIRPQVIWAEISAFHLYDTDTTYSEFNDMMISYGYEQKYLDNNDTLYIRNDLNFTDYSIDGNIY